jgi:pimeloyl-ACP methyl ester carboxylesterase
MTEHLIESFDGTSIWFTDTEVEGPIVVLLHGLSMTSITNFDTNYGPDEAGRIGPRVGPTVSSSLRHVGARVVAIDARGHGRAGRSADPGRYEGDAHAQDVEAVLDAIEANQVDLVGYSMGSYTAARLLSREPRLRAVALCGTGPRFVEGSISPLFESLGGLGRSLISSEWDAHPDAKRFRAYARLDTVHDFASIGAAAIGITPVPLECLTAPKAPVLVINGGNDDGTNDAATLAAMIPGAVSTVIGEGNHGTAPSDPLFQAAIVDFLQRHWSINSAN